MVCYRKNSNGYFYTQSKLKTDDGELFGTFSVKAKNASAYVETRDNPTPTQQISRFYFKKRLLDDSDSLCWTDS